MYNADEGKQCGSIRQYNFAVYYCLRYADISSKLHDLKMNREKEAFGELIQPANQN